MPVALGAALFGLGWIDPLFFPLVLLGPVITGIGFAVSSRSLKEIAVVWLTAGSAMLVSDAILFQEDVLFHAVVTAFTVAVSTAVFGLTRVTRRRTVRAAA